MTPGTASIAAIVPFSPLFIGEDSSIQSATWRTFHRLSFQSPLHRGRLFNLSNHSAICFCSSLSVPSSSGKTLQFALYGSTNGQTITFSPLFIGEDSSMFRLGLGSKFGNNFQSPLHRGRLFNLLRDWAWWTGFLLSVPSSSGKTLQ